MEASKHGKGPWGLSFGLCGSVEHPRFLLDVEGLSYGNWPFFMNSSQRGVSSKIKPETNNMEELKRLFSVLFIGKHLIFLLF
jgi:outer membrane PBP1 activator LpoA protein